ncbi:hypothetical protein RclHR1_13790005 [Rhizophagus clarus]|uniref:Uncharacterized protein n=1 Tax=Rhizophagus clarus TaxID=94130 RepID=A0A2Z6R3I2_9GLOM|nr:hypothetical protein RclHR1_13790005 [Rhizophagus clarus]
MNTEVTSQNLKLRQKLRTRTLELCFWMNNMTWISRTNNMTQTSSQTNNTTQTSSRTNNMTQTRLPDE